MENEFIPYEQALALKELGFEEECFYYWDVNTYNKLYSLARAKGLNKTHYHTTNFNKNPLNLLAPLYQQAFRFFREKYSIQLGICHIHGGFDCWTNDGDLFENGKYCNFKTYEEAELECIKKLIEITKNTNK